ncbi:hypothetical protein ACFLQW_04230 [Candidatus Zixiibacteriota bacterium]
MNANFVGKSLFVYYGPKLENKNVDRHFILDIVKVKYRLGEETLVDYLKRQFQFYAALALVLTLLSFGVQRLVVHYFQLGASAPLSIILELLKWTFVCAFAALSFIAAGISKFARDDPYDVLRSEFTMVVLDPDAHKVEITRDRLFIPYQASLRTLPEEQSTSDGNIISRKVQMWTVSPQGKKGYHLEREIPITSNISDFESSRNIQLYVFQMDAPLERKSPHLHRLSFIVEDGFTQTTEYYMIWVANYTEHISFRLISHPDRPIDPSSISVVQTYSRGRRALSGTAQPGHLACDERELTWEIDYPDVGDSYKIVWTWSKLEK